MCFSGLAFLEAVNLLRMGPSLWPCLFLGGINGGFWGESFFAIHLATLVKLINAWQIKINWRYRSSDFVLVQQGTSKMLMVAVLRYCVQIPP